MAVSANTLFHFTKFNTLQNILSSKGFWPQYSYEHFDNALPKTSAYIAAHIPMVCFCDLRLTQLSDTSVSEHTDYFGKYGLGFKKKWGINKKISPVSYVHNNSVASSTIDTIIDSVNKSKITLNKDIITNLGEIVKFLKPYDGYYQKGKKRPNLITYYDEREWRFIPSDKKYEVFPSRKVNKNTIKILNIELQSKPLEFTYSDIKYVILSKNKDIKRFISAITTSGFTSIDKDYLVSKIITFEEIREDY